jgi:hypothetical protein
MKNPSSKIAVLAVALIAGAAEAAPVTYDFTATDFFAAQGSAIPASTVSGNFTLDGTTVTQINLTIGSHTYTPAEVGYDSATSSLGGLLNGIQITLGNTDDFVLSTDPNNSANFHLGYTVANVSDVFYSFNGSVTPAVPVPAAAWLFGSGLVGLASVARKRK